MSRIKTIKYQEATGKLKEIYDDLISKRGKLAEVHCIQSLRPESIVKHIDLYMEIMFSKSELSRAEREMMAVVVSAGNKCKYCQIHHAEALNHYWKNEKRIDQLRNNYKQTELTNRELRLCEFSHILTTNPELSKNKDITKALKDSGITDSGILDATLVVAYFNFVNRIVIALDIEIENNSETKGYKY